MADCSQHRKDVFGEADMTKLAEEIGNLHYETLTDLLYSLANKIGKDARKDQKSGKDKLAEKLYSVRHYLEYAADEMSVAWEISKPFMKEKEPAPPEQRPVSAMSSDYTFQMRPIGWYQIRTKKGWQQCFYNSGWYLTENLMVIEVEE